MYSVTRYVVVAPSLLKLLQLLFMLLFCSHNNSFIISQLSLIVLKKKIPMPKGVFAPGYFCKIAPFPLTTPGATFEQNNRVSGPEAFPRGFTVDNFRTPVVRTRRCFRGSNRVCCVGQPPVK